MARKARVAEETVETIYFIDCKIPPQPKDQEIEGYRKIKQKQKFERVEIPESFENVELDSEGNPIYDEEQIKFIQRELDRCINGHWLFINGNPTYLTGDFYGYLNYWVLEDGSHPEYRDADRRFFLFLQECRNDPDILGIVRGKKRREGATSQASYVSVKTATFQENARCGTISKTGKDAEDLFVNMIVYGFLALPIFLQPRFDTATTDPKRKLVFVKPAKKGKKTSASVKREGLNSFIDWRNLALNSYDSGRFTFIILDEIGKYVDLDCYKYWQIVMQTLVQGAKKVGFAILPTTVNPPNAGGENFLRLWNDSSQQANGRRTPTRLVRYFQSAADGYPGFIDEFGGSMIKEATEYILDERSKLKDAEALSEHRRMYPLAESDMFCFDQTESPFNLEKIDNQIDWLQKNPKYLRRGNLYFDESGKVQFSDDKNGNWHIYEMPKVANNVDKVNGQIRPGNNHIYCGGVDPYRLASVRTGGSKGVICMFKKQDSSDADNSGMPVAFYKGRPRLQSLFHEEVLKAAMFWGCAITFEMDAGDSYYEYFRDRKALALLGKTPDSAINKGASTKKKIEWGIKSADPFALSKQLEVCVAYVEHHIYKCYFIELLEELKQYKHDDRTAFDTTIALMMALLASLGTIKSQQMERREKPILEVFTPNLWKWR